MKSISASLIVLSGSLMICVGAYLNSDTGTFVMFVGSAVGLAGLLGWFTAVSASENK